MTAFKILSVRQMKKKILLEVGLRNAQVCVYLCLHALGRVHFQWHSCYMFPASHDIITIGMANAPQNMGQLVVSSLECP